MLKCFAEVGTEPALLVHPIVSVTTGFLGAQTKLCPLKLHTTLNDLEIDPEPLNKSGTYLESRIWLLL